jgi:hypothetical protein
MNLAGACLLLFSERTARAKIALLGGSLAAGAVFAMVSAPVWYTFYRALGIAYTSYNAPLAFQVQPGMLVGLFDEAFYRPFQEVSGVVNPSVNFLVLVGVLWALVCARSLFADRRALGLLAASLPAFAIVFGIVPPGLLARTPFLGNILHVDNAFSCALVVILSVLAGFGVRDAFQRLGSAEGRSDAVKVLSLVAALFAIYFGTVQSVVRGAYSSATWGSMISLDGFIYGYAASLFMGVCALLASGSSLLRRGGSLPALVLLIAALCLLHWRLGLKGGPGFDAYVARPTDRFDLKAHSDAVQRVTEDNAEPSRSVGFHNDLLPGWNIVYGIEGISGPDALSNPYYRELLDTAGINRVWDWRYIIEPTETERHRPILDALGVKYYLGYHVPPTSPDSRLSHVASDDMEIFKSDSAWPRAFFTDRVAVYSEPKEYWAWLKSGDGRPFAAISRGDWDGVKSQPEVSGSLAGRSVVAATDYRMTTNSTSFRVSATGPGVIVLGEAYEKDNFRAWLNGKRVYYTRVNHAFKGIMVDAAGTYDVRFTYWPHSLSTSLDFCYTGLGLLAAALAYGLFGLREVRR